MAISFPTSPVLNETYTVGTKTWLWNGYAWDLVTVDATSLSSRITSSQVYANGAFDRANSAYGEANTAASLAQRAYDQANTGSSLDVSSYNHANSAYNKANTAYSLGQFAFDGSNSAIVLGNASFNQANLAFNKANSSGVYANTALDLAQLAYNQANTATAPDQSSFNHANSAYDAANSAASFANGAFTQANTVTSTVQFAFDTANSASSFANGAFNHANSAFDVANSASSFANGSFTQANTAQDTATSAGSFANSAFDVANSASSFANGAFTEANTAYDIAISAGVFANGAFDSANSKVQAYNQTSAPSSPNDGDIWVDSSTGIQYEYINDGSSSQWVEFGPIGSPLGVTGDFSFSGQTMTGVYSNQDVTIVQSGTGNITLSSANTVTGNIISLTGFDSIGTVSHPFNKIVASNVTTMNVSVTGVVQVNNSTFMSTSAAVSITGSSSGIIQTPSNDGYMLHITGKDNVPTRTVIDAFGTNAYPLIAGRHARGTPSSPTAVQTGDVLMRLAGNGWGTTGFAPLGTARIDIVAAENYTDTARGSRIEFWNIPTGANTSQKIASFNAETVEFNGTITAGGGFAYTPRVNTSNSIAQTINFTTDSFVRTTITHDTTITLSGFQAGKVVDVFVTNKSGATRNFTHGVSAENSTIGSLSKQIGSGSTMYLKYISYDGDLANTFVAITIG